MAPERVMPRYRWLGRDELDLSVVPKPLRAVLRAARDAGAVITLTARGHYKIDCPNGTVLYSSPNRAVAELSARRLTSQLARQGIKR